MTNEENEVNGAPEESKEDKFKRLAQARVNNAMAKIALIGNLSSSSYSYTAEQVEKILIGLKSAIEEVEKKFQKGLNKKGFNDEGKFKL
jgi:hypothetical protein